MMSSGGFRCSRSSTAASTTFAPSSFSRRPGGLLAVSVRSNCSFLNMDFWNGREHDYDEADRVVREQPIIGHSRREDETNA